VSQEAVNHALSLLVVSERFADDVTCEVKSERADLATERNESGLTLCLDLRVSRGLDASCLSGSCVLCLCNDLLAVFACSVADVSRFLARASELSRVLLQRGFRLALCFVCLGNVALDGSRACVEQRGHLRESNLPNNEE